MCYCCAPCQAALLRQQREERRKARLLEVREQENNFAKKVRDNVKAKREEERRAVEEQLQAVIAASEEAELRELEAHYLCRQKQIGQGHKQAQHIIEVCVMMHEHMYILVSLHPSVWRGLDKAGQTQFIITKFSV